VCEQLVIWGTLQIQDRSRKQELRSHLTGPNQITEHRPKKPVSPWPTVLVRTDRCTTQPVANFLIVATGLGFATGPWKRNGRESNRDPLSRESNVLTITPHYRTIAGTVASQHSRINIYGSSMLHA